jgi:hypothetical protein
MATSDETPTSSAQPLWRREKPHERTNEIPKEQSTRTGRAGPGRRSAPRGTPRGRAPPRRRGRAWPESGSRTEIHQQVKRVQARRPCVRTADHQGVGRMPRTRP